MTLLVTGKLFCRIDTFGQSGTFGIRDTFGHCDSFCHRDTFGHSNKVPKTTRTWYEDTRKASSRVVGMRVLKYRNDEYIIKTMNKYRKH